MSRSSKRSTAGAVLVDGRSPEEFAKGHLRHAINIGLEGRYAEFAGSVLPSDVDIVLFTEPGHELKGKNRLARLGFDRVIGYVDRPFEVMFSHRDDVQFASRLTAKAFDAPRCGSWRTCRSSTCATRVRSRPVPSRTRSPSQSVSCRAGWGELDPAKPTVVYCAGGYRSSVAASLLRQRGFADVSDILGGFGAWDDARQNA